MRVAKGTQLRSPVMEVHDKTAIRSPSLAHTHTQSLSLYCCVTQAHSNPPRRWRRRALGDVAAIEARSRISSSRASSSSIFFSTKICYFPRETATSTRNTFAGIRVDPVSRPCLPSFRPDFAKVRLGEVPEPIFCEIRVGTRGVLTPH